MSREFRRVPKGRVPYAERLRAALAPDGRILVTNAKGNVMMDCTVALFKACCDKGHFMEPY